MPNILIGCDPEVFVKQGEIYKSAHGLIRGDKKNPQRVNKGAVQVDGMALEFNIDPAASEDEFVLNVNTVFDQLKLMVPTYEIAITPTADFDPEYMDAQPEEAKELGCDPDYNAYTGFENPKPNGKRPFRTASGHVHIGWTSGQDIQDPQHIADAHMVGRQMDYFLGLGSMLFDNDQKRRSMYGKAGCVRIKPYGVEYRTLSNAWLKSPELMRWVFRNAKLGVEKLMAGEDYTMHSKCGKNDYARRIIDGEMKLNSREVQTYLDYFNLEVPNVGR